MCCVHSLIHVQLFGTLAHQAPLSMGFSRQEYWSGLSLGCHSLLQGISLTQGSNPGLLHCRQSLYLLSQGSELSAKPAGHGRGLCRQAVPKVINVMPFLLANAFKQKTFQTPPRKSSHTYNLYS